MSPDEIYENYLRFLHYYGDPHVAVKLTETWVHAEVELRKADVLQCIANKLGDIGDCLGSPEMGSALGNIASISIPEELRVELLREKPSDNYIQEDMSDDY